VKHLKIIFKVLFGLLTPLIMLPVSAYAQESAVEPVAEEMDSIEISLLTCQPHDEVYSLYGHTAIRYHDLRRGGIDAAFNYGVFDYRKPFFVGRFVFGLTDYELGAYPFRMFCGEYRHFGSMVTEQVLNLTTEEKKQLRNALSVNMLPENTVYRYNYFYNNCTTKARDIIEQCINGELQYTERENYTPTYREMVHDMTEQHPWAQFGNDFLLGVMADKKTDRRQQEFLPNNLMYDFDHAQIYADGQYRPLVKERRVAVPAGVQMVQSGFPLSPSHCACILLAVSLLLFAAQWYCRRAFLTWDLLLMVVTGVLGIILTLMIFSQHPTVNLNLQIVLFNPLPWFFLWKVIRQRTTRYWTITAVLSVLYLLCGAIQDYPEGIYALALCLLLQCCVHLRLKARQSA
jgi:hypothetical protein